jgi:hypothetical protein
MSFYVYIIPKETIILQIQIKKRKMATILKLAIKNVYQNEKINNSE